MSQQKSLREIIHDLSSSKEYALPLAPRVVMKLQLAAIQPDFFPERAAEIMAEDASITLTVLREANSTYYRGMSEAISLRDALNRIGKDRTMEIVVESFHREQETKTGKDPFSGFKMVMLRHSLACAVGSAFLAKRLHYAALADTAFLAGLLHDIGGLHLAAVLSELRQEPQYATLINPQTIRDTFTSFHAEHGAELLRQWSIPDVYVKVVAHHGDTEVVVDDILVRIVSVVDYVCRKMNIAPGVEYEHERGPVPGEYLAGITEILLAEVEIAIEDFFEGMK